MKQCWLVVIAAVALFACQSPNPQQLENVAQDSTVVAEPNLLFGLAADSFNIASGTIARDQSLSTLLSQFNVSSLQIHNLAKNTVEVFDVRKIRPGKPFTVFSKGDSVETAHYFVYEKSAEDYVVFCLHDSCYAYTGQHPIRIEQKSVGGVINSSLYATIQDLNLSPSLAMEMANIFAWTIDFYRLQKGDAFKITFEEKYIDSVRIGTGKIDAVLFEHSGEDFYAFRYLQDSIPDYFDETGASLRKAFLKAPLKFSRISSGYSKKRFHPVLKTVKAHLGTDYAAPTGTPILAVGDGEIIKSEFKQNNGNYVKIRHNGTYETQYLHMSKRAVKVGDYVRQGDVIGYVGSTGLATGPHVCFRFWKNGQQIDHLKEKFPPSEPITEDHKIEFTRFIDQLKIQLDAIELPNDSTALEL